MRDTYLQNTAHCNWIPLHNATALFPVKSKLAQNFHKFGETFSNKVYHEDYVNISSKRTAALRHCFQLFYPQTYEK